jgi:pimeloyl-ACP methyl ester carboxylesterase
MDMYNLSQRAILPILLVSLVMGLLPVEAQSDFVPKFEEAPCFVPLPEGVIEGQDVICGYVTVPETHANPSGSTIRIAVAVIKSRDDGDLAPTVFIDGGPGASSLGTTLPLLAGEYGQPILAGGRDLIMVEQRGNFFSEPHLTCPEVSEAFRQTTLQELNFEEGNALLLDGYRTCWKRLTDEGINLSAYNSVENAADFPMVVEALGYDKYNIYGVSYGTLVAQHLVRDYPEGIRSVALNAVMTLDRNVNVGIPVSAERDFQKLFDSCAADTACQEHYPDLETVFLGLVETLNVTPFEIPVQNPDTDETVTRVITGNDLVRMMAEVFYPETIPDLPQVIYALASGDPAWVAARVGVSTGVGTEALGMMYSVICAEDADFTIADLETETPIQQAMAAGRPREMLSVCEFWNVDRLGNFVDEPVTSDIPTLLMTGDFDIITPPTYMDSVAQNLSSSYAYTFPGEGHGGMDPCRLTVMLSFFNDPTQAPDTSCIGEMGVVFNVPVPPGEVMMVPVTLDELGIGTVVPEGWSQPIPGLYTRGASAEDQTALMIQAFPGDSVQTAVEEFFASLELDPPSKFNEVTINNLTWELYALQEENLQAVLAGTVGNDGVYLVLLQTSADEDPGLINSILSLVLEAFSIEP